MLGRDEVIEFGAGSYLQASMLRDANDYAFACGLVAAFIEAGTVDGLDTRCAGDMQPPPFVLP